MFCKECGNEIPDGSLFCTNCGAKNSDAVELSPEQAAKIKKRNRIIVAVSCAVLILCALIYAASVFIKPTINLNKYITVSFEGYNTIGEAVVTFDIERFKDDYEEKLIVKEDKKSSKLDGYKIVDEYLEYLKEYLGYSYNSDADPDTYYDSASDIFLSNCVKGSLDKDSGLSNGDVVTYKWNCNDEYSIGKYGYKLKYTDITYTVSGLKETVTFDPFDGVGVTFEGISGYGTANVSGVPSVPAAADMEYDLNIYEGLANGDIVTVTASVNGSNPVDYFIENYGMIPSPLTKTYTVEGLDDYVKSVNDISDAALKDMQDQAKDVYYARIAQNWGDDEILQGFTYIGNYLLTGKKGDGYRESENLFYLVYKVQVEDNYFDEYGAYDEINDIYWYICYNDLLVSPDGATTVDVTDYETPDNVITVDSGLNDGWWNVKSWTYYGYKTLDELYKTVIISNTELYNHEDNVNVNVNAAEVKADKKQKSSAEEGIIFPNSSEEVLSKKAVKKLSDKKLRYAINEIYARHGYIFNDDALREYYEQYDWYEKQVKPEDFSTKLFNNVEKKNMKILQEERDKR